MDKELAKTLTLALVSYLDENRPEGTMDCSSGECVSLEKAFTEENFDSVETLIKKKLSRLTEFQDAVRVMITEALTTHIKDGNGREMSSTVFISDDTAILLSAGLLDLAKKELARRDEVITLDNLSPYDKGFQDGKAEAMADLERTFECNPDKLPIWLKNELAKKHLNGYSMGRDDAMRDMMDFLKSRFSSEEAKWPNSPAINVPIWTPPCYNGGPCTNPSKDCINCPRANVVISPNTASGTSTATLHGNTSATDGKEHNPSFTD